MAILSDIRNLGRSLGRRGCLWILGLLLLGGPSLAAQTAGAKEYEIKAAFLLNFAQFVEWPAPENTNAPFRIGVLGEDPFGAALDETIRGETVHARPLVVVRATQAAELKDCQLVFISKSEKGRMQETLSELDAASILTVSEVDGFARRGGIINFYFEDKKVRFEINPTTAQRHGLKVSSQLLRLAKVAGPMKEDR